MYPNGKLMHHFIDEIPDSKLEGGIQSATIVTDCKNFHFDNQGLTTAKNGKVQMYNLQLQVNAKPHKTSLRKLAYKTVATVLVPVHEPTLSAADIKQKLKEDLAANGHFG